jgi:ATP:corrinoid adenosyltransferase
MARMIPSVMVNYRYDGEREIAQRLQNDPATENWCVLHSLDIVNHRSQVAGECDFVIIIPRKGILCVEVKGCRSLKVEEGIWYYGTNKKGDKRGPFKQSAGNMHSIRQYLLDKRPDLSRIVFWSTVIFPYIVFSKSSPEWHDWQIIDARSYIARPISQLFMNVIDQARLLLSASSTAKWFKNDSAELNWDQRDIIVDILRPEFEFYESPAARRQELHEKLKQFTREQYFALDTMQANARVVFDGPAGTGKSLLAIEAARRAILQGKKTLFLCFNKFFAQWIKSQFSESDFKNLTVSTLHALMLNVCQLKPTASTDSKFWNETLPEQAIEGLLLAGSKRQSEQFDVVVIDEAQDVLRNNYLDYIDLCLAGGIAAGTWNMFGDFVYQQIYSAATMKLKEFIAERCANTPVYTLGVNCRNTPRIAAYAPLLGGLTPDYSKILRADDNVKPELIFFDNEQQQKDKLAELLLRFREKEKFKGEEIIILSPKASKCCAVDIPPPWRDRVKPFMLESTGGHIRYTTIHSFKGLEAPVVIVTDLDKIKDIESRNLLYIAVTRSLSRLILLIQGSTRTDLKKILGVE